MEDEHVPQKSTQIKFAKKEQVSEIPVTITSANPLQKPSTFLEVGTFNKIRNAGYSNYDAEIGSTKISCKKIFDVISDINARLKNFCRQKLRINKKLNERNKVYFY